MQKHATNPSHSTALSILADEVEFHCENMESTLEKLKELSSLFAVIQDLAATGKPYALCRIQSLAGLGQYTSDGWLNSVNNMLEGLETALKAKVQSESEGK